MNVTTDKVTGAIDPLGHEYHIMYGLFLIPVLKNAGRATKMLEIGLGCAMNYGPGASALLWRKLLPTTELWEADIDELCIKKHQISMLQQGIHTLVGNQNTISKMLFNTLGHGTIDDRSVVQNITR